MEDRVSDQTTTGAAPSASSPPSNNVRFVESDNDVIGRLGLHFYLTQSDNEELSRVLLLASERVEASDVIVFRLAAQKMIDEYTARSIDTKVDVLRSSVTSSAFNDVVRSHLDSILDQQREGLESVKGEVAKSGSAWRQIVVSMIASLLFGVTVGSIKYIMDDDPVGEVIGHVTTKQAGKGNERGTEDESAVEGSVAP